MGTPTTSSARSTTSMARSTPAQNPRGPARTISWRGGRDPDESGMVISIGTGPGQRKVRSREEVAHAENDEARVDAEVLIAAGGVRDVLRPVAGGEGDAIGDQPHETEAALDDEVHVAVRLGDVELTVQDAEPELDVRTHDPSGPEHPAAEGRQPEGGGRVRLGPEGHHRRLGQELEVPAQPAGPVLVGQED